LEIADKRVARRTGPARQPRAAPTAREKALSGRHRVPTSLSRRSPAQPTDASRRSPARSPRACRRRADSAASLVPLGFRPRHAVAAAATSRARPSPGTPRRRLHAGEPSPPRRLRAPASRRRRRAAPPRRAPRAPLVEAKLGPHCARGPRQRCARAVRVGRADAAGVGHARCASGPSVNSAQCTRLNFIKF
jgi:hypothetical protein